jgi:hypothetical protein
MIGDLIDNRLPEVFGRFFYVRPAGQQGFRGQRRHFHGGK